MTKKYRLEINYPVSEAHFDFVHQLKADELDGKICEVESNDGGDIYKFENGTVYRNAMTMEFLTEIIEPLKFEEWNNEQDFSFLDHKINRERAWLAGIENDHLKIMEGLEFAKVEYIRKHCGGADSESIQIEHIWNSIVETLFSEPTDDNT